MKLSNFPSFSHLVLLNRALAKNFQEKSRADLWELAALVALSLSLFQGKSRADLWELAALVALDLTVERANRACDLDFHARHQVSWLAHIWKAHSAISHLINRWPSWKAERSVKSNWQSHWSSWQVSQQSVRAATRIIFLGRKDCVSEDPEGRKYVTTKPEV